MPIAIALIAVVLIVVAFNNTHGQFASALEQDIPSFFAWAMAIVAIMGLGYVPGMKIPSRWLLALVALVVVLVNGQTLFANLQAFGTGGASSTASGASAAPANPTTAYATSGGQSGTPTATQIAGGSTSSAPASATAASTAATSFAALINPSTYTTAFSPSIGFGGLA